MAEVTRLVTAGNFDPKGKPIHENNVWIIGNLDEVIVIDPAHDPQLISQWVDGRHVKYILLTHGHWDHIRSARSFAAITNTPPICLNADDNFLWSEIHGNAAFQPINDGEEFTVAGAALKALATPGHTPGSTSFYSPELGALFSGDTLFDGGPGATRWDYSSFDQILDSISTKLLTLPDDTVVNTGHGPSTTIGAEKVRLDEWRRRGW